MNNADRAAAMVLGGMVVLLCGACSQPWEFARIDGPMAGPLATAPPSYANQAVPVVPPTLPTGATSPCVPSAAPAPWAPSQASATSFASLSQVAPAAAVGGAGSNAAFGLLDDRAYDPPSPGPGAAQDAWAPPGFRARLRLALEQGWFRVVRDHRNYYGLASMRDLCLGVAVAAVPANTSWDDDFQGWYQRDVRSSDTDDFAAFWKTFGEGAIFIPAYAGLAVATGIFDHRPLIGGVNDFSDRVTRGYLVGAPPMLLMQALLGGSRPGEHEVGSQWKPLDDSNGVSGHAFIGAVPFITAAKMCDRPLVKATFYTLSTFPAWSRVNDDAHYLSQACLGWWMAYLACRAVDETEQAERWYTFTPLVTPEATGMALVLRR